MHLLEDELTLNHRVYHAHEATAVEPFAIALLCGDVRCDVRPHISADAFDLALMPLLDVFWSNCLGRKSRSLRCPRLEDDARYQSSPNSPARGSDQVFQAAGQAAHCPAGEVARRLAENLHAGFRAG